MAVIPLSADRARPTPGDHSGALVTRRQSERPSAAKSADGLCHCVEIRSLWSVLVRQAAALERWRAGASAWVNRRIEATWRFADQVAHVARQQQCGASADELRWINMGGAPAARIGRGLAAISQFAKLSM